MLVIRSYVKGGRNIRLNSSPKVIYSSLCTTHNLTAMFLS